MTDKNFQHLLEVLNEVETKKRSEKRLSPIPEKINYEETGQDCKTRKLKPLRRPGFVYRKKDLSKTTFLENNLWELTCGRRVLKAPLFKYRHRRKSKLSPYSLRIFDTFNSLSLSSSSSTCENNNCPKIAAKTQTTMPKSIERQNTFLPLSSEAKFISRENRASKRKLPVIQPGKFQTEKISSNQKQTKCDLLNTTSWKLNSEERTTFSDLSTAENEPCKKFDFTKPEFLRRRATRNNHKHTINNSVSSEPNTSTSSKPVSNIERSCSFQARMCEQDMSVDELSIYMEDFLFLPQKMSSMAEMMYT